MPRNRISELCRHADIDVSELARRIGWKPAALRRYARHESEPKTDLAMKIASALGVTYDEVVGERLLDVDQIGRNKLPLYAAAEAGRGFDITDMSQASRRIDRPAWLAQARDAYAVVVAGTSMEPRYYEGEVLYVDPARPPRPGSFVVVQFSAQGAQQAVVKQLVRLTEDAIVLRGLNPDQHISFSWDEIVSIHVVTGSSAA